MRFINLIVVHCSATRCDRSYTEHDLTTDHLRRGFSGAGYHFYIRKNGDIKSLRPLSLPGAHVRGWNAGSIGVCYEGGLDECGRPADTRTLFQKHSLRVLVLLLLKDSTLQKKKSKKKSMILQLSTTWKYHKFLHFFHLKCLNTISL